MSDRIFPDNEIGQRSDDKNRIRRIINKIKGSLPSSSRALASRSAENELEDFEDFDSFSRDYTSQESGLKTRKDENFWENIGFRTYIVLGIEFLLLTYFALAALGYVPMF